MTAHFPDHKPNFFGESGEYRPPRYDATSPPGIDTEFDNAPLPTPSEIGRTALQAGAQTGDQLYRVGRKGLAIAATVLVGIATGSGIFTAHALKERPTASQQYEFSADTTIDTEKTPPLVDITTPHRELLRLRQEFPGIEIDAGAEFIETNLPKGLRAYLLALEKVQAMPIELGPLQAFDLNKESASRGITKDQLLAGIDPRMFIGDGNIETDTAAQLANRKSTLEFMSANTELFTNTGKADPNMARNIALFLSGPDFRAYHEQVALLNEIEANQLVRKDARVPTTVAVSKDEAVVDGGHLGTFKITEPTHVITAGGGSGWGLNAINWAFQTSEGYATENDGITKKYAAPRLVHGISSTEWGFVRDLTLWDPYKK